VCHQNNTRSSRCWACDKDKLLQSLLLSSCNRTQHGNSATRATATLVTTGGVVGRRLRTFPLKMLPDLGRGPRKETKDAEGDKREMISLPPATASIQVPKRLETSFRTIKGQFEAFECSIVPILLLLVAVEVGRKVGEDLGTARLLKLRYGLLGIVALRTKPSKSQQGKSFMNPKVFHLPACCYSPQEENISVLSVETM
jgi:hypothetical protein